jgi:hypothetical protein
MIYLGISMGAVGCSQDQVSVGGQSRSGSVVRKGGRQRESDERRERARDDGGEESPGRRRSASAGGNRAGNKDTASPLLTQTQIHTLTHAHTQHHHRHRHPHQLRKSCKTSGQRKGRQRNKSSLPCLKSARPKAEIGTRDEHTSAHVHPRACRHRAIDSVSGNKKSKQAPLSRKQRAHRQFLLVLIFF